MSSLRRPHAKIICPHCKQERYAGRHVDCCPLNPVVYAAVHAALEDADEPGAAVAMWRYNMLKRPPAIGTDALTDHYGNWAAVCLAHGLHYYGKYGRGAEPLPPTGAKRVNGRNVTANCPHCDRQMAEMYMRRHLPLCPENPANVPAIHAAAAHPTIPGVAVLKDDYDSRHNDLGVPASRVLMNHFGGWLAAMAYYGLRVMGTQEAAEMATMAETAAAAAEARRVLAEERNGGYGLAVAKIRPAPGLSVNGRECVRCELR